MSDVSFKSASPVFVVNDVDEAVTWYTDKLGFVAGFVNRPDGAPAVYAVLQRDNLEIHLCRDVDGTYSRPVPPLLALSMIAITGVDEFHDLLSANDVKIFQPPTDQFWGGRDFIAEDPDGNKLWFAEIK